jgi:hypothetical protein
MRPHETGFLIATELATSHMPEDPASTALAEGYVMDLAVLYEQGFGVPSH